MKFSIFTYINAIKYNPNSGESYWSLANLKTYEFGNLDVRRYASMVYIIYINKPSQFLLNIFPLSRPERIFLFHIYFELLSKKHWHFVWWHRPKISVRGRSVIFFWKRKYNKLEYPWNHRCWNIILWKKVFKWVLRNIFCVLTWMQKKQQNLTDTFVYELEHFRISKQSSGDQTWSCPCKQRSPDEVWTIQRVTTFIRNILNQE